MEEPEAPAPAEPPAGSGILADVPHWRTNPAAFAARLEAPADGDADRPPWTGMWASPATRLPTTPDGARYPPTRSSVGTTFA